MNKEQSAELVETPEEKLERAKRILREAEINLSVELSEIRHRTKESTKFRGVVGLEKFN